MKSKPNSTLSMFLKYLIPSMLAMALLAIYTFTDTFVVGKELGELTLSAFCAVWAEVRSILLKQAKRTLRKQTKSLQRLSFCLLQ